MTYDVINLLDELEMLDIRLHELDPIVDKLVVVESTRTFQNGPKELVYDRNKAAFSSWQHKIIHVIVDDGPDTDDPWAVEEFQLNAASRALADLAEDDFILWCNADEVPNASVVSDHLPKYDGPAMMMMRSIGGYMNCWHDQQPPFTGGRIIRGSDWKSSDNRYRSFRKDWLSRQVKDCGWHFFNCGGLERTRRKVESYAHKELNHESFKNSLEYKLWCCYNLYDPKTGRRSTRLPITDLPEYVQQNEGRFSHMLVPEVRTPTPEPKCEDTSGVYCL